MTASNERSLPSPSPSSTTGPTLLPLPPLNAVLADSLTLLRMVAAGVIVWLGWTVGGRALPAVLLILTMAWIGDAFDGILARRTSRVTLLRSLDFPVDVALTWALLAYLTLAGFTPVLLAAAYTAIALISGLWLHSKAVLSLLLRGVDFMLVIVAAPRALPYLLPLLVWLIGYIVFTRRRNQERTQRWLNDMSILIEAARRRVWPRRIP